MRAVSRLRRRSLWTATVLIVSGALVWGVWGVWGGVDGAVAQEEPPVASDDPVPAPEPGPESEPGEVPETAPDEEPGARERALLQDALAAVQETQPTLALAFERLAVRDWDGALEPFLEVVDALEPHALLGGLRDQCLYNAACAYARTDRPEEAVAALAESLEHGLRPVATPAPDGRIVLAQGLNFAHILVDSDLESLRDRADYQAVLDGLLRAGEPRLELTAAAADVEGPLPGAIVVLEEDRGVDAGAQPWRDALADVPAVVVYVEGPVRPNPRARRWLLVDGDDRFAVDEIESALDLLRSDERVDPSRVYVSALSSGGGECALAAALGRPREVAGLSLGPFRFHAAWHADALHELRAARGGAPAWTIAFMALSDDFANALVEAGVTADRRELPPPIVTPEARGANLRDTVIDGLKTLLQ